MSRFPVGVLGCTTDAGQVTIIIGWSFYAGTDATQIGAGQYDFQTVVTHELGHVLGLGHSADNTSVMHATLNPGEVKRALTGADLNVPDTDTGGACGLHAALPAAGNPLVVAPARGGIEPAAAMQPAPLQVPAARNAWARGSQVPTWLAPVNAGVGAPGAVLLTTRKPTTGATEGIALGLLLASAGTPPSAAALDQLFREIPAAAGVDADTFRGQPAESKGQPAPDAADALWGADPWEANWQADCPAVIPTGGQNGWEMPALILDSRVGAEALVFALAAAYGLQPPEEAAPGERPRQGRR
jgi:hypothetical protein